METLLNLILGLLIVLGLIFQFYYDNREINIRKKLGERGYQLLKFLRRRETEKYFEGTKRAAAKEVSSFV